MARYCSPGLVDILDRLHADSITTGEVPMAVADYARQATLAALHDAAGVNLERRAEAYFRAVVRRRIIRTCGGTTEAARIVAASVVEDLIGSGRSSRDAWEELNRGWSHLLTPELSVEFRQRLCA